jgi:hypothetical protein
MSAVGTSRTFDDVRFRAVIRGIADIKRASSVPTIYEYAAWDLFLQALEIRVAEPPAQKFDTSLSSPATRVMSLSSRI